MASADRQKRPPPSAQQREANREEMERETRFELATSTLARLRSTN